MGGSDFEFRPRGHSYHDLSFPHVSSVSASKCRFSAL